MEPNWIKTIARRPKTAILTSLIDQCANIFDQTHPGCWLLRSVCPMPRSPIYENHWFPRPNSIESCTHFRKEFPAECLFCILSTIVLPAEVGREMDYEPWPFVGRQQVAVRTLHNWPFLCYGFCRWKFIINESPHVVGSGRKHIWRKAMQSKGKEKKNSD